MQRLRRFFTGNRDLKHQTEDLQRQLETLQSMTRKVVVRISIDYSPQDVGGEYEIIGIGSSFRKYGRLVLGSTRIIECIYAHPGEIFVVRKRTSKGDFISEPITARMPEQVGSLKS